MPKATSHIPLWLSLIGLVTHRIIIAMIIIAMQSLLKDFLHSTSKTWQFIITEVQHFMIVGQLTTAVVVPCGGPKISLPVHRHSLVIFTFSGPYIHPNRNILSEFIPINFDVSIHSQFKNLLAKSHRIVYFLSKRFITKIRHACQYTGKKNRCSTVPRLKQMYM